MSFLPSWLTGTSGAQSQDDAAANIADMESRIDAQAKQRLASGEIDQEKFDRYENAIRNAGGAEDVDGAYREGFGEGLQDGINNEKKFANGFFSGVLGAVPASVWIILAIAGFIYFGGLDLIKRKVASA